MYISEYLAHKGNQVILSERESDFMKRASYGNQARVHNGCHYPRSVLTSLRSRVSFPRFISEFEDCVDGSFDKYYMISSVLSQVSANQFVKFCNRVGIKLAPAPQEIIPLVNPYYIEKIFSVKEFAFDSEKIKNVMLKRMCDAGVSYYLNHEIHSIKQMGQKIIAFSASPHHGEREMSDIDMVFNCTYSMTNKIVHNSNLNLIPLKHEMSEIALVKVPKELQNFGMTVMDGPFFSFMPFPPKGVHSFSHVRYTPHYEWHDKRGQDYKDASLYREKATKNSAWSHMIRDASRYIPKLLDCQYIDSIWEIKTVLPFKEHCDSRPILFRPNYGLKGFHNIVGGKIDNVYDVIRVIESSGVLDGK